MEFKEYKLEEITLNITDGVHNTVKDDYSGEYYLLSCKNIKKGTINITKHERKINFETFNKLKKRTKLSKNDILITTVGTIGEMAMVKGTNINYDFQRSVGIIKPNDKIVNPEFLYYSLLNEIKQINSLIKGAVQKCLFIGDIKNIIVKLPSLEQQNKIVKILSDIDKKIELNNKINDNLQTLSQELYKRWFIDFEFPNEEGKPFKTSGGKMVESELGEIPEEWEVRKLSDFFDVITGKKDANAGSETGIYPFFTCGQSISGIDNYSFDEDAILLTGNGDFNVKFYRGKFDAYQRTYVLIPKKKDLLAFLYQTIVFNLERITSGYRGSVIKFITKGSIENYKIPFKKDLEIFGVLQDLLLNIEIKTKENESLIQLKERLLPALINGEIDLDKIEV